MITVDEYIKKFPPHIQDMLSEIRDIIIKHAPGAVECISYGMPAYKLHGKVLVYFAGYTNHIGFYAMPSGHSEFAEGLSKYKHGKGSVQFPLDKPLPRDLIRQIVEYRVEHNKPD